MDRTHTEDRGAFAGARDLGGRAPALLAALVAAAWLAVALLLWPIHGSVIDWDEVDYYNAARQGVLANALDRGSLTPGQFLSFALAKARREAEAPLPPGYDEPRDPLILRHYHPPFVVYLVALITGSSDSPGERLTRSAQILGALALIACMLLSYLSASRRPTWPGALTVVALGALLSYLTFFNLNFHGWTAVWTVTTAALLSRWLAAGQKGAGVLLCLSLALVLATLESGLVVWGAAALCLFVWVRAASFRERLTRGVRLALAGTGLTALFVALLWPGAFLKISLVKTPVVLFYRSLLGQDYRRPVEPYLILLPLLCLTILACGWLLYRRTTEGRRWGPFAVVGAAYVVVVVVISPFTVSTQYLAPGLAPLACVIALAVDGVAAAGRGRAGAALALALVCVSVAATGWTKGLYNVTDAEQRADYGWLREVLRGREVLADGEHIYQHYTGAAYHIEPVSLTSDESRILVREGGKYRPLAPADVSGKVVLFPRFRAALMREEGPDIRALLGGCRRVERPTLRLYDCAGPGGGAAH